MKYLTLSSADSQDFQGIPRALGVYPLGMNAQDSMLPD
jgi:hypothetical protein